MSPTPLLKSGAAPEAPQSGLPSLPLPLFLLQPILAHVVARIARLYPEILERLGPHQRATFIIDPVNMPFALALRPEPGNLMFRAVSRSELPKYDARIAGRFLDLLRLVDSGEDGDAMFFSRGLEISGNVDAVVTLRNALDNVDGSIAESVAGMFGPPGRLALNVLRRMSQQDEKEPRA